MRKTNALEKLVPSVINAVVVFVMALPLKQYLDLLSWKLVVISLFLSYNLLFFLFNRNKCLGMMLMRTKWHGRIDFKHELLYVCLYTLSFSTLLFSMYAPFDLFVANMLLLQLPAILLTGTTFHGWLSGNKVTMIAHR